MNFKKWVPFFFVLCTGLTDAAYRNHVIGVIKQQLPNDDLTLSDKYVYRMVRKAIRYSKTGADEDTAARCFLIDMFVLEYGIPVNQVNLYKHGMKHLIEENYPGEGIEP